MTARGAYIADRLNTEILDCLQISDVDLGYANKSLDQRREIENTEGSDAREQYIGSPRTFDPSSLGSLSYLPFDVLAMILPSLDMNTLANFRLSSRGANEILSMCHEYAIIRKYAPAVIEAIHDINLRSGPSCKEIYQKLFDEECQECGDFAKYLYLPTCRRVCTRCLLYPRTKEYFPPEYDDAKRQFGLNDEIMSTLPTWEEFNGPNFATPCLFPTTLVDVASAHEAGIKLHGSAAAMYHFAAERAVREQPKARAYTFMPEDRIRARIEEIEKYLSEVENATGVSAMALHYGRQPNATVFVKDEDTYTFGQIIAFPVLDKQTKLKKVGRVCRACDDYEDYDYDDDDEDLSEPEDDSHHELRMFTTESFERHLREVNDQGMGPKFHDRRLSSLLSSDPKTRHLVPNLPAENIYLPKKEKE